MIGSNVARRYAKALLEIGVETSALDTLVAEISRMAEAYDSSTELKNAVENPLIPHSAQRAILAEIADRLAVSPIAKNTLFMLAERRRLRALPSIAQLLREMTDLKKGVVRAQVTAAAPLSEAYYAKLAMQLEKMTGKKVVLDRREDPSLIAGVVTRIGDTVYDGSLLARLTEMKQALLPN